MKNEVTKRGKATYFWVVRRTGDRYRIRIDAEALPELQRVGSWIYSSGRFYAYFLDGKRLPSPIELGRYILGCGCESTKFVSAVKDPCDYRKSNLKVDWIGASHGKSGHDVNVRYLTSLGLHQVVFKTKGERHSYGTYENPIDARKRAEEVRQRLAAGEPVNGLPLDGMRGPYKANSDSR